MSRRIPLWVTLIPLVVGVAIWLWLWRGYADGFRAELGRWLTPGAEVTMEGFPYRLEADIQKAEVSRQSDALAMDVRAAEAVVNRVPWQRNRQVITLIEPQVALAARQLGGADLNIAAPHAQASLRIEQGRIGRLSAIWDKPQLRSGLFVARVTADNLETHLRETPAARDAAATGPAGPAQAEVEMNGAGVRVGEGAPLGLELAATVTADAPLGSYAAWAAGGTVELQRIVLSDASGEVARITATVGPDPAGHLRIAGTVDTACPLAVRAAISGGPPVSEKRLRRPMRIAFSGTLPGGVTAEAADPAANSGPVRAQEPPCPRLR